MTTPAAPIVQLEHVSKVYRMGRVDVYALRELDFEVDRGEFVVILLKFA